jgi:CyaY protein
MSEQDFLRRCDAILDRIEDVLEGSTLDLDTDREGHILTVTFEDDSQMVINGQVVMREIWLAYAGGAHHFKWQEPDWLDTRSGDSLSEVLSRAVSAHSGQTQTMAI